MGNKWFKSYFQLWVLGIEFPRVKVRLKPFITHYSRLGSTVPKLKKLLSDFQFTTVRQAIDLQMAKRPLEMLNVDADA